MKIVKLLLVIIAIFSLVSGCVTIKHGFDAFMYKENEPKRTVEQLTQNHTLHNMADLGQYYSGSTVMLFTLATVLFIILAYINQREEIKHLKDMNDKQDIMLKGQIEKDEFEKFERTFYKLLDWHMSFMNSISYVRFVANTTRNVYVSRGAINQVFTEFKNNFETNLKLNKSIDECINTSFDMLFKNNDDMKPYYNNLYSVLEFVEDHSDTEIIDEVDINKFITIITNQLSNSEVLLLCYFGLYTKAPLNTKKIIEEYSLLRNIQIEYVETNVLSKYTTKAFKLG